MRLEALAKADGRGIGRLLTQLGIVGTSSAQGEAFSKRLDDVKQEVPPCAVYDLKIAEEIFAAAALPAGVQRPSILKFPPSTRGIQELLGQHGNGLDVDRRGGPRHKGSDRSVAQPG